MVKPASRSIPRISEASKDDYSFMELAMNAMTIRQIDIKKVPDSFWAFLSLGFLFSFGVALQYFVFLLVLNRDPTVLGDAGIQFLKIFAFLAGMCLATSFIHSWVINDHYSLRYATLYISACVFIPLSCTFLYIDSLFLKDYHVFGFISVTLFSIISSFYIQSATRSITEQADERINMLHSLCPFISMILIYSLRPASALYKTI